MKTTIDRSFGSNINIVFYLSYAIYLIFSILCTSFYAIYVERIFKHVIFFCGILLIINETANMRKYSLRTIAWMVILAGVLGITLITSSNALWVVIALLFAYVGRNIHFKSIARFTILIETSLVLFVIISALLGIITNYVSTRATGEVRNYMGFLYPLIPAAYVFNITVLGIYVSGMKIKWKELLFLLLINQLIFMATNARLSFILAIFLLLISAFFKVKPHFFDDKKIISNILSLMFPICCLLSFYFTFTYNPSDSMMRDMNSFLGDRLEYGRNTFLQYGFSLFGQDVTFYGNGLSSTGKQTTEAYNYVDNLYLQILINFGVVFLLVYLFIHTVALIKSKKQCDYLLFCIFVILALHGLIDDLIIRLHYNALWFVIGSLAFTRRKERPSS